MSLDRLTLPCVVRYRVAARVHRRGNDTCRLILTRKDRLILKEWLFRDDCVLDLRLLLSLGLCLRGFDAVLGEGELTTPMNEYAPLPEGLTSFGAAIVDKAVFLYGGQKGRAHHYYRSGQLNELWKLDLMKPDAWEVVGQGPHLQGHSLVAHAGQLYRIGGFTAHNQEDEDQDLRSIADVVRFDPKSGSWTNVTPLPEPRSSHDAVLIGDHVYVVGGWRLHGEPDDQNWHSTAWAADLSETTIWWERLPDPSFRRRALSLGTLDGKLYVIGGMQEEGSPTARVDVYDPTTRKWEQTDSLVVPEGDADLGGMEGFGASAFVVGERLFVSTYGGNLQCLERGSKRWRIVAKLKQDRFFHRMLPFEGKLLLVGGASMEEGKRRQIEAVDLAHLK